MSIIGIIPAAGKGERMQPLGFSKELLPLVDAGRVRAVSEYIIERMILAGATEICIVIAPDKTDIVSYYADHKYKCDIFFVVQPEPLGLCDAIFRAAPYTQGHSQVLIGLPDTVWFPEGAFELADCMEDVKLNVFRAPIGSFLDSVVSDTRDLVSDVYVKSVPPNWPLSYAWIWGAMAMHETSFTQLELWWSLAGQSQTMQFGDLLNLYISKGGKIRARFSGQKYMDVGTVKGYQEAQQYLAGRV